MSGRSLRALLTILLGAAANAVAIGTPGSLPLLLGVVVPTRFANRGQPGWALLAGVLVGLATGSLALAGFGLLLALLSVGLSRRSLAWRLTLMPLLALPAAAGVLLVDPPLVPWPMAISLLCLNALLAQFASYLLFDLPGFQTSTADPAQRLPSLRSLLTSRFTIALAPGLFVGLLLVGQWYWSTRAGDQAADVARSNAQMLAYVEEHVGEHLRAVAQAADDASASDAVPGLVGLRTRLQGFLTLLVTDAQGRLIDFHAPGSQVAPAPVDDRDYFIRPRDTGLPFVSGVFRGRGFGSDPLVAVSAPYFDDAGRFRGVVEGSLSLDAMRERLQDMARGGGLHVVLRDATQRVVVSSLQRYPPTEQVDDALLDAAQQRGGLPLNVAGDHLLVEQPLPQLGWSLATLRPLAPLAKEQTAGHLLLGVLCLSGLALIHWLSARFVLTLSGPLDQLLGHIRGIDLAKPGALRPLALEARFAELAELREDFNALLQRLGELDQGLRAALLDQAMLNQDLEQRVARRTEDLREALLRARQLADAKSIFLANMSHELRTPLTSILGYAELAMGEEASHGAREEALRTIHRQGEHLLAVVNDVLDAGRIESGSLRVEALPVSLDGLLRDLQDTFAERARVRGIRLRVVADAGLPPALIADPLRLRQVLINLLGNALKFTAQGTVTLRARRCLGALVLSVSDTGVGIDETARSRLFLPFSQADLSTTRRFGGSGLGLYISRRLCETMGGRLTVHSRPGAGSRFAVLFPLTLAATTLPSAGATAVQQGHAIPRLQGRVLVADDVEDLRRLVCLLVSACGAEVRECGDGSEALQLAASWSPDLVLMDMHMPVMDGIQATRALRERGLRTPVVALTADVLAEDRRRFLDAGCDEVLHKPIRREALQGVLHRYLQPAAEGATTQPPALRFDDLRQRYAQRLGAESEQLERLRETGEHQALLEKLHTLKGSAGTFGFAAVSAASAALETVLRDSAPPPGAEDQAFARLLASLEEALAPAPYAQEDGGTPTAGGTLGV